MIDIQDHIASTWKNLSQFKLFLACSGGVDSMTLLAIFAQLKWDVEVIHVNYQLRGEDSNLDQQLVEQTSATYGFPVHVKRVDLHSQLENSGGNLQEIARNIRYDFFEAKRKLSASNRIALAHHQDDQIETFFMHVARKSGIMGLACMHENHDQYIRPLLPFSKDEIISYAQAKQIAWREDQSNGTNKYRRNILRNIILPKLYQEIPELKQSITHLIEKFQATQLQLEITIEPLVRELKQTNQLNFNRFDSLQQVEKNELLRQLEQKPGLLVDLEHIRQSQKGKKIHLERSAKNPFSCIVREDHYFQFLPDVQNEESEPLEFSSKRIHELPEHFSKNEIYLDASSIKGKLQLRRWKTGDRMQPLGMKGTKLLSDIIKDAKIPASKKDTVLVLCDEKHIFWCVGIKISAIGIANQETKEILHITI